MAAPQAGERGRVVAGGLFGGEVAREGQKLPGCEKTAPTPTANPFRKSRLGMRRSMPRAWSREAWPHRSREGFRIPRLCSVPTRGHKGYGARPGRPAAARVDAAAPPRGTIVATPSGFHTTHGRDLASATSGRERLRARATSSSSPASAFASTLQGRVLDPQEKSISGARVRAENEGTSFHREATTDAAGAFTLPELPPGSYTLVAEASGFAPRTQKGVRLLVGQTVRLDVVVAVAAMSEAVEAVAEADLATVGSSTVDGVIGQTAIERLPLNGRNFLELAFLVPGNVPTPNFDPTKTNSVVVASAGQMGRGGMITIDGAENNDDAVGGPAPERAPGRGAGVPDRDQPLLGRERTLRRLRHQRGDRAPAPTSSAAARPCSCATSASRPCPRPTTAPRRRRPSTASSTRSPRAAP